MNPTVLHVDINSYFATILQQKYPHLRGLPIGIIKDVGRTCIIAASKEAKALGVATGSYLKEAKAACPQLILVPAEFDLYLDTTRRLKQVFTKVVASPDIFSLDEAFLDISEYQHLYPHPHLLAQNIQADIKSSLGSWVTCNIGISKNKFLSKLASEVSPKGSICHITPDNQDFYLMNAAFKDVCGVGFRLEKRLSAIGVSNLYQINFIDDQTLIGAVGKFWADQIRLMSKGENPHMFTHQKTTPHMKSVGRSITLFKLSRSEAEVKAILYNLTMEVIYKVRKMHLCGRHVWVGLFGQKESWTGHLTSKLYIDQIPAMFDVVYHQLAVNRHQNFPIIKFAVSLSLLKPVATTTSQLLPDVIKREKIEKAIDHINHTHGLYSVTSGLFVGKQLIRPEVTGFLGDKTYYGL